MARRFRIGALQVVFCALALGAALLSLLLWLGYETLVPLPHDARADRIVIEKSQHRLTLYRGTEVLAQYPVALGRGGLSPKRREGDKRTPEGHYTIIGRNPNSAYHLSLRISYPDATDTARASTAGVNAGSDIMIHGIRNGLGWLGTLHRQIDWTQGCIAVTNAEIRQIWDAVPDGTAVEIKG